MLGGVFEKLSEAAARRAARLDVRDREAAGDGSAAEKAVALWKQVTGREWTEA